MTSDNTKGLHWCLCSQATRKAGSESHSQLLIKYKAYDGVRPSLGERQPHGCRQVHLGNRVSFHKHPDVTRHNIRGPEQQKHQRDHVIHLAYSFLHLELVQDEQPAVGDVRRLPDAH